MDGIYSSCWTCPTINGVSWLYVINEIEPSIFQAAIALSNDKFHLHIYKDKITISSPSKNNQLYFQMPFEIKNYPNLHLLSDIEINQYINQIILFS
jgi:hypothetical protein